LTEIDKPKDELKVGRAIAFLGFFGLMQFAAGLFTLTLIYGIVVIILRYAFHVELWNPFR
jgi:hypothetical protein